ncbi:MAG: hypothetical protein RMI91_13655 [Gemmatales bacterium]|nr:hypothetical protein [Gemmatales bacterium]MDW7995691.1 hypothetical protein [Gemmatales bacterium]
MAWSKQLGLARLPISIFEDEQGPPAYRLPADDFVVVVAATRRKVVTSWCYPAQQFTGEVAKSLIQETQRLFQQHLSGAAQKK